MRSRKAGSIMDTLSLVHLGRIEYAEGLALQRRLCGLRRQRGEGREGQEGNIGDVLLLLEHPPVLTLGRNADPAHVLADPRLLAGRGIPVIETDRGGDVTYHGPGQLVGYPILDLRGFSPRLGAVDYMRRLEEVVIRACADYGVLTQRIAGRTGVWTLPGGAVQEKKIAAFGVHFAGGVTSHGFAVNVSTDLRDFRLIVPCGIADREVTSMEAEVDPALHPVPTLEEMSHSIARHFARVFGRQVVWLASLEDLLASSRSGRPPEERGGIA